VATRGGLVRRTHLAVADHEPPVTDEEHGSISRGHRPYVVLHHTLDPLIDLFVNAALFCFGDFAHSRCAFAVVARDGRQGFGCAPV